MICCGILDRAAVLTGHLAPIGVGVAAFLRCLLESLQRQGTISHMFSTFQDALQLSEPPPLVSNPNVVHFLARLT